MTRTQRKQKQVAAAIEDVADTVENASASLAKEAERLLEEHHTELAVLHEKLAEARRQVAEAGRTAVSAMEPYRPPVQYRGTVRIGVLLVVSAVVVTIMFRKLAPSSDAAETTEGPEST